METTTWPPLGTVRALVPALSPPRCPCPAFYASSCRCALGPTAQRPLPCSAASTRVISCCVAHLWQKNVLLEGTLIKPQMIIPGADYTGQRPGPDEVCLLILTHCLGQAHALGLTGTASALLLLL